MIERLYLKDCLSFKECELEFKKGLIVFTGPSGAGKSVLIDSILSLFGIKQLNAKLGELTLNVDLNLQKYGIESDDLTILKGIKRDKNRFFINSQSVSKKVIKEIFKEYVGYLSQKDEDIFSSKNILKNIDEIAKKVDKDFSKKIDDYQKNYYKYREIKSRYENICSEEKKVNELIEFAKFEIDKIDKISPKIGEYEELLDLKKELSKKEKIKESIFKAQNIFDFEDIVIEALDKIGKDYSFFTESMNELREIFEKEIDRLNELEDIDIEEILNRIEELSNLKRRYGSIKEALEYKKRKEEELSHYENIEFEKRDLEDNIKKYEKILKDLSKEISKKRIGISKIFEKDINHFLKNLKLSEAKIEHKEKELDSSGIDEFFITLKGVNFNKISSGEFNRLRLAFLAAFSNYKNSENGVLILDEIDANVSGEESKSIANILKKLSKNYQIFAISHQPQLSSVADQHILIFKKDEKSFAKELNMQERVNEIARIISGEKLSKEAIEFAQKALKEKEL